MAVQLKSEKKRIYVTMVISVFGLLLHCFISLVITPQITNILGVEAYGFVSLSRNFVAYVNIIMIAFNAFAARYVTFAYVNDDLKAFNEYYNSVFWANTLVGGGIVLLSLLLTWKLEYVISIPVELVGEVKLLFLLTFLGFYLTEIGAVFGLTGYVKNRLDIVQMIRGLSYVLDIVLLIFCYFVIKPHIWYMGLAAVLVNLLVFVGNYLLTKKLLPEAKYDIKLVSKFALKNLVSNGIWNSFNGIGNSLNSGLDLLISNLLLSATGMGQIAIAKNFTTLTSSLNTTLATAFHPNFLKVYSEGNREGLIDELKYSMKVCGIPINVIFAGFIAVGQQFLSLWIPTQNTDLLYVLVILAMLPSIAEGPVYPLYYIYTLTIRNKIPCLVTILGGLANVLGMYILLKYTTMGVYSVLITTAVIMGTINFIINPIYMSHCLNVKLSTFYPEIIKNVISVVITSIILREIVGLFPYATSACSLAYQILLLGILGFNMEVFILMGPKQVITFIHKTVQRFKRNN